VNRGASPLPKRSLNYESDIGAMTEDSTRPSDRNGVGPDSSLLNCRRRWIAIVCPSRATAIRNEAARVGTGQADAEAGQRECFRVAHGQGSGPPIALATGCRAKVKVLAERTTTGPAMIKGTFGETVPSLLTLT
jgi:hypothetical protein